MPSKRSGRTTGQKPAGDEVKDRADAAPQDLKPGILITFRPQAVKGMVNRLKDSAGISNVAYAADFKEAGVDIEQTNQSDMLVFNTLGVAVADADPDQLSSMSALTAGDDSIISVEPEPIFFAFGDGIPGDFLPYLRGYRDAVDYLYQKLTGGTAGALLEGVTAAEAFQNTAAATWGLLATKVADSGLSGRGVRIAVLDTGMDLDHPDFRGRGITSRSFIQNQGVQDENGHGTHCIGTACGPKNPTSGPRYGVAYESEIFVGKVLSNQGSSLGRSTIAGVEWAVNNRCQIVSMSLGGRVLPGQAHSPAFEQIALEAMRNNTLVIAAAGNDSRRSQNVLRPVGSPANCPSVMAVAAVDRFMRVADFSNGSINQGARVDIAGPGVEVYSSAPEPAPPPQPPFFRQWSARYDTISGTSMATPHVSGIAALLKQENPDLSAAELWRLLSSKARTLPLPSGDVGAGLVQVS
jgi:subtilisin family serine protease